MSDPQPAERRRTDPLIGQRVGSYVVERLIGVGGMGSVYRGIQPAIQKKVAIKFLANHLNGDPRVVGRFFDEAKAVNLIGNENIVDIFDFGQTSDGQNFFVMELLEGPSLAHLLEKYGAMAPTRAVSVGRQMAGALAAAHAQGIIHRDLKPENVFLVTRAGRSDFVKVLDFGIAKLAPRESSVADITFPDGTLPPELQGRRTQTGVILGTPGYMAPEQASGDAVDQRVDIYSLGVLLYHMLGGEEPFHAENFAGTLLRQLTETPRSLRALREDIPGALDELIQRMLSRMAAARPSTMSEVADALNAISLQPLGLDVRWIGGTQPSKKSQSDLGATPTSLTRPISTLDRPTPPPAARRNLPLLPLVFIGALVAAVPFYFLFRGAGHPREAIGKPVPGPAAVSEKSTPQVPTENAAPPPVLVLPTTTPPAPLPGPFVVHVESSPPGAQVFVGDRAVAATPSDVRLDTPGPLFLRLAGYHDERLDARRESGSLRIELRRVRAVSPPHPKKGISLDD